MHGASSAGLHIPGPAHLAKTASTVAQVCGSRLPLTGTIPSAPCGPFHKPRLRRSASSGAGGLGLRDHQPLGQHLAQVLGPQLRRDASAANRAMIRCDWVGSRPLRDSSPSSTVSSSGWGSARPPAARPARYRRRAARQAPDANSYLEHSFDLPITRPRFVATETTVTQEFWRLREGAQIRENGRRVACKRARSRMVRGMVGDPLPNLARRFACCLAALSL
jgi:hypothetical protein